MQPIEVTNIINKMPVMYGQITDMNLFQFKGTFTETVAIDRSDYTPGLIPASPWCCDPKVTQGSPTREMFPIQIPHTQLEDALWACDISGVRAETTGFQVDFTSVADERAKVLARMKMNFDITYEYRLLSALKGKVMDAGGVNVLADLFQIFGATQKSVDIPINEAGTDVIGAFRNAVRVSQRAARSFVPTGWRVIAGKNFFDRLVAHDNFRDVYKRSFDAWNTTMGNAANFRFSLIPGVEVMEYWGTVANDPVSGEPVEYIGDDEAIMFPIVPRGFEMYELLVAPPKTLNFVNTRARNLVYMWEKLICERSEDDAEGIKMLAESNYLPIVKHPDAIIRLNMSCGPEQIDCSVAAKTAKTLSLK
jgi:hypothetical protein